METKIQPQIEKRISCILSTFCRTRCLSEYPRKGPAVHQNRDPETGGFHETRIRRCSSDPIKPLEDAKITTDGDRLIVLRWRSFPVYRWLLVQAESSGRSWWRSTRARRAGTHYYGASKTWSPTLKLGTPALFSSSCMPDRRPLLTPLSTGRVSARDLWESLVVFVSLSHCFVFRSVWIVSWGDSNFDGVWKYDSFFWKNRYREFRGNAEIQPGKCSVVLFESSPRRLSGESGCPVELGYGQNVIFQIIRILWNLGMILSLSNAQPFSSQNETCSHFFS